MGGQAHPKFHPTLVFSMLDEMLDAFDQGLTECDEIEKWIFSPSKRLT